MKDGIIRCLSRNITSDAFDARLAQTACLVAGLLVLVLSLGTLARLQLSEAHLFLALLLSLCPPLLLVLLGLLVHVAKDARSSHVQPPGDAA